MYPLAVLQSLAVMVLADIFQPELPSFNPCSEGDPLKYGESLRLCASILPCPEGYTCHDNYYFHHGVCCLTTPEDYEFDNYPCNGPALRNKLTNSPAWCAWPQNTCPNNYVCDTTLMDVSSKCCPGDDHVQDICRLPEEGGMCLAYFPRYFFNSTSSQCERFIYGGCGGNGNNFRSLESCQNACLSKTGPSTHHCGEDDEPATYRDNHTLIECNVDKACPFGLLCGDRFGIDENACYCHGNLGIRHSPFGIENLSEFEYE